MLASPWRAVGLSRRSLLLIGGILLLLAASGLAAWATREVATQSQAATARRALEDGRLDEAAASLDQWLKAQPDNAEAHYLNARLAWARNDFETADRELSRARQLGYSTALMIGLRGLLLAGSGQTTEAEPALQQAFDGSSRLDPEVANALARLYLGTFRMSRVTEVLERWRRETPADARPYLLQAEIDMRGGAETDLIVDRLRTALRYDPGLDRARLELADQLRLDHRNTEAIAEYQTYQERKPHDFLGYLGAGLNALELGDEAEAIRFLDQALERAPHDPVVLGARASVESRRNRPDQALDYLDRAVTHDPFDHANHYQRMLALSRLGRMAEAEVERGVMNRIRAEQDTFSTIRRDLERNPLDLELRRRAACWLMNHGHQDEAIDWANLVLRLAPTDPAMNRLLADHYRGQGKIGLANFHETHAAPVASPSFSPGARPSSIP